MRRSHDASRAHFARSLVASNAPGLLGFDIEAPQGYFWFQTAFCAAQVKGKAFLYQSHVKGE